MQALEIAKELTVCGNRRLLGRDLAYPTESFHISRIVRDSKALVSDAYCNESDMYRRIHRREKK